MTHTLQKQGRAWLRLPRPLHAALLELRASHPKPLWIKDAVAAHGEPNLEAWKLARLVEIKNPVEPLDPLPTYAWELNDFGLAFARPLPEMSKDKRTMPPLFPLADVLAGLPQGIRDWLSGDPPLAKLPGGVLFEVLGVLTPDFRGESYHPTRELMLAFQELREREQGGRSFTPETFVDLDITPTIASFIAAASHAPGVDVMKATVDGRQLRPWNATPEGAGIVLTADEGGRTYYRLSHEMRSLALAVAAGERDGFKLAMMMPDRFKEWVANSLSPACRPPRYDRLPALIGLTKKKGKFDWQLTPAGKAVVPMLRASMASQRMDDELYVGDGVEIVLPDEPDNPWDILGEMTGTVPDADARALADEGGFHITLPSDTPPEQIAEAFADLMASGGRVVEADTGGIIEADTGGIIEADTGGVIEAPVPSNAELAAAKARREARHPVADLSLDDEFDIL